VISGGDGLSRGDAAAERIQKILSAHGIASRRDAEKMILEGRVTVNGLTARLGQSAQSGRDDIAVDGTSLSPVKEKVYIMLNKPRGYITTRSDERGRKTVMELVEGSGAKVYPVGRLDMYSEGLLLMTNDGQFANSVAHPSNNHAKTYELRVRGDAAGALELLRRPMEIDSRIVQAKSVSLVETTADGGDFRVTVGEGRNRQIRKMCALCGLRVLSLRRVSIGALEIGALEPGHWRYLTEEEIKSLNT